MQSCENKVRYYELLINAGADPNIQDEEGVTALLEAARHDNRGIIKSFD